MCVCVYIYIHTHTKHTYTGKTTGKYVVKMFLNGCVRGIVVDDLLPVSATSPRQMLCTYSKVPGELWPSIFEKAYLKLHGGYDFRGSTSSIDLHALCAWIPETFRLDPEKRDTSGGDDPEACWRRMLQAHTKGTALFTMGTKAMSPAEEERSGLAEKHAYAVLDVAEACGRRLVKLKNPWANLRWKGAVCREN
jgi:calpain-7